MRQVNLLLALVGGLVLLLSLGSGLLRSRGYLPSEPILAVAFGVVVGPHGLAILQVTPWSDPLPLLEQLARITVALAVTSIALRLPPEYFAKRVRSLAVLLGPGMVAMWLASAFVVDAVLAVGFPIALLVGAAVTPTDPVIANSIVTGNVAERNIPVRLRYLLSGEAGINDGAAYLFVFLPVLVLRHPLDAALSGWVLQTLAWEVTGAVVLGFVIGGVVGRLERWESAKGFLDETSVLTVTVALTFAVLGAVKLLGSDGILAVFVAGVAYNWQADPGDETDEQRVEEVLGRLFTVPVFVLFGMAIPWTAWMGLGWRGPALVLGVLLFRRLPMILAFRRFVPPLDRHDASLFVGWFGPIGVAAVFYATLATRETGTGLVWVAASLVVAGSILAHGMTATVATRRYGRTNDANESW